MFAKTSPLTQHERKVELSWQPPSTQAAFLSESQALSITCGCKNSCQSREINSFVTRSRWRRIDQSGLCFEKRVSNSKKYAVRFRAPLTETDTRVNPAKWTFQSCTRKKETGYSASHLKIWAQKKNSGKPVTSIQLKLWPPMKSLGCE